MDLARWQTTWTLPTSSLTTWITRHSTFWGSFTMSPKDYRSCTLHSEALDFLTFWPSNWLVKSACFFKLPYVHKPEQVARHITWIPTTTTWHTSKSIPVGLLQMGGTGTTIIGQDQDVGEITKPLQHNSIYVFPHVSISTQTWPGHYRDLLYSWHRSK